MLQPPDTLLSAILVDLDQLYKGWVDKRGVRQHITNLGGQCLGDLEGLDLATGNDVRGQNWMVTEEERRTVTGETLHLPQSSRHGTHRFGTVSSAPVISSHGVECAGSTPTPAPTPPALNWDGVPLQKGSSSRSFGYSVSPQLPSPSRLTLQHQGSYTSRDSPQRSDNDSQTRPHIISPDSVDQTCQPPEPIQGYGDGAYDSQPEPFMRDTRPGLDLEDPLPRAIWNPCNVNVPPPVRTPTTKEENQIPITNVYPASQLSFRRMLCHVTPPVLKLMFQSLLSISLPVLILLYRPLVEFLAYGIVQSLFRVPLSIPRGVTESCLAARPTGSWKQNSYTH